MLITEYLNSKTDEQLISEYRELDNLIEVFDCYNPNDLNLLTCIHNELVKRGYEFKEKREVEISKKGDN